MFVLFPDFMKWTMRISMIGIGMEMIHAAAIPNATSAMTMNNV